MLIVKIMVQLKGNLTHARGLPVEKMVTTQNSHGHYYSFLPALQVQLIPNTTATHTVTN